MGLRKTLLSALLIGVIVNGIKIIENTVCIIAGRFLFGLVNGFATFCQSKALNDTIPPQFSKFYATVIGNGLAFGLFTSNLLSLLLPLDAFDESGDSKLAK